MASDLSQADAGGFLAHFDRSMPGFERLATCVRALSDQNDVASSVSIAKETGDDLRREFELDWTLQLSGKAAARGVQQREQIIRCTFEHRKKRWVVTRFEPIEFFAPAR